MSGEVVESHGVHVPGGVLEALASRHAALARTEGDVVAHVHPGKECRRLEDDDAVGPGVAHLDVADPHLAAGRRLEAREHVHER